MFSLAFWVSQSLTLAMLIIGKPNVDMVRRLVVGIVNNK